MRSSTLTLRRLGAAQVAQSKRGVHLSGHVPSCDVDCVLQGEVAHGAVLHTAVSRQAHSKHTARRASLHSVRVCEVTRAGPAHDDGLSQGS